MFLYFCLSFFLSFVNAVFSLCFVSLTSFHIPPKATKRGVRRTQHGRCEWEERMGGIEKACLTAVCSWMEQSRIQFVQDGLSEVPTSSLKTSWRHGRQELGKQRPGFVHTIYTLQCLYSVSPNPCLLADLIFSSACICFYLHPLLIMLDKNIMYLIVKSNWCGMPTADIWAQLYSLEMTSKPYFREQKTCIFR